MEDNNTIRPSFRLRHANAQGTGSCLEMILYPAHPHRDGFIMFCLMKQRIGGARTYDWENRIALKLSFAQVSKIIEVLRGEKESLNGVDGVRCKQENWDCRLRFEHCLEPVNGYSLRMMRARGGSIEEISFFMSISEAVGICVSLEQALLYISFGIPVVGTAPGKKEGEVSYAA